MPRPTPEFTPKVVTTKSGRYGGAFGNYEDVSSTTATDAGVVDRHRRYVSVSTPNYENLRLHGRQLPYNSYTMELNTVNSDTPFRSDTTQGDGWTYFSEVSSAASTYPFTPLQLQLHGNAVVDARNKAMMRLGDKASGVRLNVAQIFGERRQTANLLASTATRIVSAARALRRADLRTFTKSLSLSGTETRTTRQIWKRVENTPADKRIASHWLEFVYGWKPLLSDVYDGAEYLADRIELDKYPSGVLTSSARGLVSYSGVELEKKIMGSLGWTGYEAEVRVRHKAHYRLENEARQILSQTGISNPLLLGWELLPYSFVVDWFVPVGTYLESLTAFDGFELLSSRSGTTQKITVSYGRNFASSGSTPYPWSKMGHFDKTSFEFTRTAMSFWPTYVLKVKSPLGGEPLKRFATAASLMRVLFSDPRRRGGKDPFLTGF